jgi:hypothetical protein
LIQADREAKELQRLSKVAARATLVAQGPAGSTGSAAGAAGGTPTSTRSPHMSPKSGEGNARPGMKHSFSTDSLIAAAMGGDLGGSSGVGAKDEEGSEMGDEDSVIGLGLGDSVVGGMSIGSGAPSPAASTGGASRTKSSKKAKPRKSKLAHELIPVEDA